MTTGCSGQLVPPPSSLSAVQEGLVGNGGVYDPQVHLSIDNVATNDFTAIEAIKN